MYIPSPKEFFALEEREKLLAMSILGEVAGAMNSKDERLNSFYRGIGVKVRGECFENFLKLDESKKEGVVAFVVNELRMQDWLVGISWRSEGDMHMHVELKIL